MVKKTIIKKLALKSLSLLILILFLNLNFLYANEGFFNEYDYCVQDEGALSCDNKHTYPSDNIEYKTLNDNYIVYSKDYTPTNLYQYYAMKGENLPDRDTKRAELYSELEVSDGDDEEYTGTSEQNKKLLEKLLEKDSTETGGKNSKADDVSSRAPDHTKTTTFKHGEKEVELVYDGVGNVGFRGSEIAMELDTGENPSFLNQLGNYWSERGDDFDPILNVKDGNMRISGENINTKNFNGKIEYKGNGGHRVYDADDEYVGEFQVGIAGKNEFVPDRNYKDSEGNLLSLEEIEEIEGEIKKVNENLEPIKEMNDKAGFLADDRAKAEYKNKMASNFLGRLKNAMNTHFDNWLGQYTYGIPAAICGDSLYADTTKSKSKAGGLIPGAFDFEPEKRTQFKSEMERQILEDMRTVVITGEKNELTENLYRYAVSLKLIGDKSEDWKLYLYNSCTNENSMQKSIETEGSLGWYQQGSLEKRSYVETVFAGSMGHNMVFDCSKGDFCRFDKVCIDFTNSKNECFSLANGDGFITEGKTGSTSC